MARTDYSGNGGDVVAEAGETFPAAWQHAPPNPDCGPLDIAVVEDSQGNMTPAARTVFQTAAQMTTGIFYAGSMLAMARNHRRNQQHVPDRREVPGPRLSTSTAWTGATTRWPSAASSTTLSAGPAPATARRLQDTPGSQNQYVFGMRHANGFQMAFCDGSVQMMSYTISPTAQDWLGNRKDGNTIDGKSF